MMHATSAQDGLLNLRYKKSQTLCARETWMKREEKQCVIPISIFKNKTFDSRHSK